MKKLAIALFATSLVLVPGAAYADKNNEPCQGEDACQGRGDCYEAKQPCEDNDLSPSFQDSPVENSFNPVVCLPGSTCNFTTTTTTTARS
jgi:hypothetical protein